MNSSLTIHELHVPLLEDKRQDQQPREKKETPFGLSKAFGHAILPVFLLLQFSMAFSTCLQPSYLSWTLVVISIFLFAVTSWFFRCTCVDHTALSRICITTVAQNHHRHCPTSAIIWSSGNQILYHSSWYARNVFIYLCCYHVFYILSWPPNGQERIWWEATTSQQWQNPPIFILGSLSSGVSVSIMLLHGSRSFAQDEKQQRSHYFSHLTTSSCGDIDQPMNQLTAFLTLNPY